MMGVVHGNMVTYGDIQVTNGCAAGSVRTSGNSISPGDAPKVVDFGPNSSPNPQFRAKRLGPA